MRHIYHILFILLIAQYNISAQEAILELEPSQSMSITGKGAGQDAAINPFSDRNSIGIVENIGENDFTIRVQNKEGKVIESIIIKPNTTKEIRLLKGYELYFDSTMKAKAKVGFKELPRY